MDEAGEWETIPYVFLYAPVLTVSSMIIVVGYLIVDGTHSFDNYANLVMFTTFLMVLLSQALTYGGGEMLRLPKKDIQGSADDFVQELSTVLSIERVRFHMHFLISIGQPVYRIDGKRNKEFALHIYKSKGRLNLWLSKGGLYYKETLEEMLRRT